MYGGMFVDGELFSRLLSWNVAELAAGAVGVQWLALCALWRWRWRDYLLPEARKEWKRLAPILMGMGLLTAADAVPFAGYCQAYARWREAQDEITRHGSIYKDGEGRIRPNPYIAIANQQMREIKSFAAEFGLTPSTRAAMIANVVSAAKAKVDPMEAILVSDMDTEFEVVGGSNFEEEDS